ncbi:precorrin-3B C(17)-methyltransferase [Camelimonas fluminis]|uniref:Precorrin-3B C(17)-methyltransferase n=1 Tax=Camelimonas fluminis TaxID=1576911 RepID=A0ABV7UEF2_9HYPH
MSGDASRNGVAFTGRLTVIGLGPGSPEQMTPEARNAVERATDFFGYFPYVERLTLGPHQRRHASDNREELARAKAALALAMDGREVAVVSGGDAGVFAMAAAICEAIDHGPAEWRALDIAIVPGVTAMLAVAACVGAPLGHDFCAISLSDNLKPWELIAARLRAVAGAGLVIALYNPVSKARPWQLGQAFDILRDILPARTPVVFGRAAGRPDERVAIVPLAEARSDMADMATCIIIGSPETRLITRDGRAPLVYAPRSATGAGPDVTQGSLSEGSLPQGSPS